MKLPSFLVDFDGILVVEDVLDYFQPLEAPRWDPQFCSNDLSLLDNDRTIYKNASAFGGGVQSAQTCSQYSVQIVKGDGIMIGFAPRLGFRKNNSNFLTCGWFLYVDVGCLWSQDLAVSKAYAKNRIPVGTIVTAIHDMHRQTIEFHINGKSLGIAFNNIPYENLYAAVENYAEGAGEIRILNNPRVVRRNT